MNTPRFLYFAAQTRFLEKQQAEAIGITSYELMQRAARACVDHIHDQWPTLRNCVIVCGSGNNAGDGYVIARLLQPLGINVVVCTLIDPRYLQGDAAIAYTDACATGVRVESFNNTLPAADVLIDALLGTGLSRPVSGRYYAGIVAMNEHPAPVLAIDIPSGLDADTGMPQPLAVEAAVTVTMVTIKPGLMTGRGGDYCGQLLLADLSLTPDPAAASVRLLQPHDLAEQLPPRIWSSHKGDHGHVCIIGGNYGMAGATLMAAQAALRAGAGLVTVLTQPEHVGLMISRQPELMVHGLRTLADSPEFFSSADILLLGPGLGQDEWAQHIWTQVLEAARPTVLDADALNLLARSPQTAGEWIITPHPGEAGRLLGANAGTVQQNRFLALEALQNIAPTVVLKGAGSLIAGTSGQPALCPHGNPGMAVGGMGDVLSGIIAALWAQGLAAQKAAEMAVLVHSLAGDKAATAGIRGLLPSDLIGYIRGLVNC